MVNILCTCFVVGVDVVVVVVVVGEDNPILLLLFLC